MKINPDLEIVHQFENFPTIPPIAKTDRVGGIISGGDIQVNELTGQVTILGGGEGGSSFDKYLSANYFESPPTTYFGQKNDTLDKLFKISSSNITVESVGGLLLNSTRAAVEIRANSQIKFSDSTGTYYLSELVGGGGGSWNGGTVTNSATFNNTVIFNDVVTFNSSVKRVTVHPNSIPDVELMNIAMTNIVIGRHNDNSLAHPTKLDNPSGGISGQFLQKTSTGVQWANSSGGGVSTDTENLWTANQKIAKEKKIIFQTNESSPDDDISIKYHKNIYNYTGYYGLTIFNSNAIRLYLDDSENSNFTWMEVGGRFSYSTGMAGSFKRSFAFPDQEGNDGQFLRYNFSKQRSEWVTITPGNWDGGDVKNTTNFNGYVDFNNIVDFNSDARRSTIASPSSLDLMNLSMANTAIDKKITTHNADTSAHPNKITNPSSGSAGQFLQKTSSGVTWADVSGGGGSWNGGIVSGDSTFNGSARFNYRISRPPIPITSAFSDEIINYQMTGEFIDNKISTHNSSVLAHNLLFNKKIDNPSSGLTGQYLRKTSSGTEWADVSGGGGGSWNGGTVTNSATFNNTVFINNTPDSPSLNSAMNLQMTLNEIQSHDISGSAHYDLFEGKLTRPPDGTAGQVLTLDSEMMPRWKDSQGGGGGGITESQVNEKISTHNSSNLAHSSLFQKKLDNPPEGSFGQVLTVVEGETYAEWKDIPPPEWNGGIVNSPATFNGNLFINSLITLNGGASISGKNGGITFTGQSPNYSFSFVSGTLSAQEITCFNVLKLPLDSLESNVGKVLTCLDASGKAVWKDIEWKGGNIINKVSFTGNIDVLNDSGEKNLFNIYDIEKNKTKDINTLGKYIGNGKRIEIIGGYVANGVSPLRLGYSDNPNALDNIIKDTRHSSWMNDPLAIPNIDMLFQMWDTRNDYITKAFYKMCPRYFRPWHIPINEPYIPNVSGYVFIRQLRDGDADLHIAGKAVAFIRPGEWGGYLLPMRDVDTLQCITRAGSIEALYFPCIFQD